MSAAEADAYYASRPMGSRIGAWASQQSRPLASRAELVEAVTRFEKEFEGMNPARPRYWSGFRIIPLEIEFWTEGRIGCTIAFPSPAKARTCPGKRHVFIRKGLCEQFFFPAATA